MHTDPAVELHKRSLKSRLKIHSRGVRYADKREENIAKLIFPVGATHEFALAVLSGPKRFLGDFSEFRYHVQQSLPDADLKTIRVDEVPHLFL